jgi:hypothetical protein
VEWIHSRAARTRLSKPKKHSVFFNMTPKNIEKTQGFWHLRAVRRQKINKRL